MFASERTRKIKELLLQYKEVDINTMCSLFSASTSTIRRDLDKLELEGFLKRTHGGAVLIEQAGIPEPKENGGINFDKVDSEVEPIAELAIHLIKEKEQIFLGSGRLCYRIACLLSNGWSGTIVTNNMDVAVQVEENDNISLIMLGGELQNEEGNHFTEGVITAEGLKDIVVNKAFVTVTGVTLEHGYFLNTKGQEELYGILKKNSLQMITVIEKSKFNQVGKVRLPGIDYFSKVISSIDIPDDFKRMYYEKNITLYTSCEEM